MIDMLVKLYDLTDDIKEIKDLKEMGIIIKRVLALDKEKVLQYVINHFNYHLASECEIAFSNSPITCYVAIKDKKIIGFACYNIIVKNYLGPMGVTEKYRNIGVGKVLALKCLLAMREEGYAYGIIASSENYIDFYEKELGAMVIDGATSVMLRSNIDEN